MSRSPFPDPNLGLAVLQSLIDAELVPRPTREAAHAGHPPSPEHPHPAVRASLVDGLAERAAELNRLTDLVWRPWAFLRGVCRAGGRYDDGVFALTSLAGIDRCAALRSVAVDGSFAVADLEPLTALPALESIVIDYAPQTTDWSPLLRIPSLRTVTAPVDAATAARLAERGVTVTYPAWLAPLIAHPNWPTDEAAATRVLTLATDGGFNPDPFTDDNLGLAVLYCLIAYKHVPDPDWGTLITVEADDEDEDAYGLNHDAQGTVLKYLAAHRDKLPELTELGWEGGDDLQGVCFNYWDGEDDTFDITSLAGIEQLISLRIIKGLDLFNATDLEPLAALSRLETLHLEQAPEGVDWTPLLRMPALRHVVGPVDGATADALTARGVYVRTPHRPHPLLALCAYDGLRSVAVGLLDMTDEQRGDWLADRVTAPADRREAERTVVARAWHVARRPGNVSARVAFADALLHVAALHHKAGHYPSATAAAARAAEIFGVSPVGDLLRRGAALELLAIYCDRDHGFRERLAALADAAATYPALAEADPAPAIAGGRRLTDALCKGSTHPDKLEAARQLVLFWRLVAATEPELARTLLFQLGCLTGDPTRSDAWKAEVSATRLAAMEMWRAGSIDAAPLARVLKKFIWTLEPAEDAVVQADLVVLHEAAGDAKASYEALQRLSGMYVDQRRHEEALAASRQVLDRARDLPRVDRLAHALLDVGDRLRDLGRHDEALETCREAMEAARSTEPRLFAGLHQRVGTVLGALGRYEEAHAANAGALGLFRALAASDRHERASLAVVLVNTGLSLKALGRYEEWLAHTAEAVDLHRQLAAGGDRSAEPMFVTALNNLSVCLNHVGRHADATVAATEAVALARSLVAAERADAERADAERRLAMVLNNLAMSLSGDGRHAEALAASVESVETFRRITTDELVDYLLADALAGHATVRLRNGQPADAASAAAEAVPVFRRLAKTDPVRYERELARALRTFAETHGNPDAAAESVRRYVRLAAERPRVFDTDLRAARDLLIRLKR
jgi:tetratricopeptide (TPR) repeat protein